MANKQTRHLLKVGMATKNERGSSPARANFIKRPLFRGIICDTHFGAIGNKRHNAWRGNISPALSSPFTKDPYEGIHRAPLWTISPRLMVAMAAAILSRK
jgi:hypothetical protein